MTETKCPICHKEVSKIVETDDEHKNGIICENEFYVHYHFGGIDKLIKIKHPVGAWEKQAHSTGTLSSIQSEGLKDFSGQTIMSGT